MKTTFQKRTAHHSTKVGTSVVRTIEVRGGWLGRSSKGKVVILGPVGAWFFLVVLEVFVFGASRGSVGVIFLVFKIFGSKTAGFWNR